MVLGFTSIGISHSYYAKIETPYQGSIGVSEHSSEAAQHIILDNPKCHPIGRVVTQWHDWKPFHTSVGEGKVQAVMD